MADISEPRIWQDVPVSAVGFKTAVRQNNAGVRVEIELDKGKLKGADPGEGGAQKMRIQTPKFRRFKIKEWPAKKPGDRVSYSGTFTIGDLEGSGGPARFVQEWVFPMEEAVKKVAGDRSIEWFKKEKKADDLEKAFTSAVNTGGVSNEGRAYGPLMKCKIPFMRGKFECDFYKGDQSKPDEMTGSPSSMAEYLEVSQGGAEGVDCVAILEYESVWFMNKDFGVTPILRSLLYWPQDKLNGFSFKSDPSFCKRPRDEEDRGPADAFLDDGPPFKRSKPTEPAES